MNQSENTEVYDKFGEVKISDDVVSSIAGLAAMEIEGVSDMSGNLSAELVGKLGIKNHSKGVKIEVIGKKVIVDLWINIKYGYSIPKTCQAIQDKVKGAIESMTGLEVSEVNIHIVGVNVDNK